MSNPQSTRLSSFEELYHEEVKKRIQLEGQIKVLEEKIKAYENIIDMYRQSITADDKEDFYPNLGGTS